ncbi:MAG: hypothetical protein RR301_07060 [Clostridia bacterium]
MAQYTIEDIEILRQKSGISYEEAVNLLEYHNGSLARALVDLEKNGRLKNDPASSSAHGHNAKGLFNFLYRLRLKVRKNDVTVVNLSSLFMLLTLLTAPYLLVAGLIVSLLLGYRITISRDSREFSNDSFDSIVKNAKSNVQHTVSSFSQQFTQPKADGEGNEGAAQGAKPHRPAPEQPRAEAAASGTKPVNVQFPDGGRVDVRDDGDGYHEADIQ